MAWSPEGQKNKIASLYSSVTGLLRSIITNAQSCSPPVKRKSWGKHNVPACNPHCYHVCLLCQVYFLHVPGCGLEHRKEEQLFNRGSRDAIAVAIDFTPLPGEMWESSINLGMTHSLVSLASPASAVSEKSCRCHGEPSQISPHASSIYIHPTLMETKSGNDRCAVFVLLGFVQKIIVKPQLLVYCLV